MIAPATRGCDAAAVFAAAYAEARKQAAAETGAGRVAFPAECPWTLGTDLADRGEGSDSPAGA